MDFRAFTIYIRIPGSVLLFAMAIISSSAVAHKLCADCHINSSPDSLTAELIAPLPDLCLSCHDNRTGLNEHVTDVVPSMIVPQELPLLNGILSCTTCHDPHATSGGQLRVNASRLCIACHRK
ncbi:MAG TPA: hypothetical protein ENI98_00985 [Gammaproteobacteria bacterium]|nr:hypothetical protein [Gammaproteobacteria bacterium]